MSTTDFPDQCRRLMNQSSESHNAAGKIISTLAGVRCSHKTSPGMKLLDIVAPEEIGVASPEHASRRETAMLKIVAGGLDDPQVIRLLGIHLTHSRAQTAPGSAHALDLAGLKAPEISFWSAWEGDDLLAVGAMKRLSHSHGEVKSMHTAEPARRRGVGSAMLEHIIDIARNRGIRRLSLETGSWAYFQPAVALYKRHGFVECPPFGDYTLDPNSIFMTREV